MNPLNILSIFFLSAISYGESCFCNSTYLQDVFCQAEFVGIVMVNRIGQTFYQEQATEDIVPHTSGVITKIYKGRYEDFREGETINLYTDVGDCRQTTKIGAFLMSGMVFNGGLYVDACSFRSKLTYFSQSQLLTIQSHINTRSYVKGCQECTIVEKEEVNENECTGGNERPARVSACFRDPNTGRCRTYRQPQFRSKHVSLKKYQQHYQTRSSKRYLPIRTKSQEKRPRATSNRVTAQSYKLNPLKMHDVSKYLTQKQPPAETLATKKITGPMNQSPPPSREKTSVYRIDIKAPKWTEWIKSKSLKQRYERTFPHKKYRQSY